MCSNRVAEHFSTEFSKLKIRYFVGKIYKLNSRQAVVVQLLEFELVLPAEGVAAAAPLALGQVAAVGQDEVGAQVGDDGGRRPNPHGKRTPGNLIMMLTVTMVITMSMVFMTTVLPVIMVLPVMVVVVLFIGDELQVPVLTQNHAHHGHQEN